jgi:hypothetical protein
VPPIPQDAAKHSVGHEPSIDRHALEARRYRDESSYAWDEVADEDGLPSVPLEHRARLVQVRSVHKLESLESSNESAYAFLPDPEPREVQDQRTEHSSYR